MLTQARPEGTHLESLAPCFHTHKDNMALLLSHTETESHQLRGSLTPAVTVTTLCTPCLVLHELSSGLTACFVSMLHATSADVTLGLILLLAAWKLVVTLRSHCEQHTPQSKSRQSFSLLCTENRAGFFLLLDLINACGELSSPAKTLL